ncbi:hypothetical protein EVAR_62345_1 [Eumeta japonica]|uniref:Uncharacterized protein n=1 Tax=Eumeta variegata TaxID=151549 RepID=A0A4C1ZJG3_EUMVA|nr:hypothetical protein EVAR_62345_1 [Eumeta japonica]
MGCYLKKDLCSDQLGPTKKRIIHSLSEVKGGLNFCETVLWNKLSRRADRRRRARAPAQTNFPPADDFSRKIIIRGTSISSLFPVSATPCVRGAAPLPGAVRHDTPFSFQEVGNRIVTSSYHRRSWSELHFKSTQIVGVETRTPENGSSASAT